MSLQGLSDVLLNISLLLLVFDVPVAVILIRAAYQRPRIWALTLMAIASSGIALLVIAYVVAALNNVAGSPLSVDVLRVLFRFSAVVLALFPPMFLYVYSTGRFRDGQE